MNNNELDIGEVKEPKIGIEVLKDSEDLPLDLDLEELYLEKNQSLISKIFNILN